MLWWARVAVTGGYGYLFADNADLAGWQSWLRSIAGDELAEYRDFGGGVFRAASFADDRIETCLFVGPARDAGDWNVVKELFAADTLSDDQRRMLLSGKSTDGARQYRPDRLRLFRCRPHHDLRCDRGRCAFGRRNRREAEGGHQLRLVHPRNEAADCAGCTECAATIGGGEVKHDEVKLNSNREEIALPLPRLRGRAGVGVSPLSYSCRESPTRITSAM